MSNDPAERDIAIRAQQRMFRLAERDYQLDRRALSLETGIPYPTLKSWANDTIISLTGLRKLVKVIPDELTSLLFAGTGKHIGEDEVSDGDLDALGCETAGFVSEYVRAKSDGVVTPIERANLKERAGRIAAHANKVKAA